VGEGRKRVLLPLENVGDPLLGMLILLSYPAFSAPRLYCSLNNLRASSLRREVVGYAIGESATSVTGRILFPSPSEPIFRRSSQIALGS